MFSQFQLSFACLPQRSFVDGRPGEPVVEPSHCASHDVRPQAPSQETDDEALPRDWPVETTYVNVKEDRGDIGQGGLRHEDAEGRAERIDQGRDTPCRQGGGSNAEFHNQLLVIV